MAITLAALTKLQDETKITTFVETGTALAQGVKRAIEAGFTQIFTIERYGGAYRDADRAGFIKETCPGGACIGMFWGDSATDLWRLLASCDGPAIVYLDAHTMNSTPQWKDHPAPVVQEIMQIGKNNLLLSTRPDIILIDDMRMFVGQGHNRWANIQLKELIAALAAVGYTDISYVDGETENDVMVARKGART